MNKQHDEVLEIIQREKLVVILRGIPMDRLDGVVEALLRAGIRVLEFTFDHLEEDYLNKTTEKIRYTVEKYGDQLIVGCGTALSAAEAEAAYEAGASLVVSPDFSEEVVVRTRELGMVSMPGAMTPTEIIHAWNAGADIVKIFPAGQLGLEYMKAIRGPLPHIPMSAVAGIRPENIGAFLKAGVCGFGISSQMVRPEAVASGDYAAIEAKAREFIQALHEAEM